MLLVRRNSKEVSLEKSFFYGGNDFWCAISRAGTSFRQQQLLDYTQEQDLTSEGNFLLSYYTTEPSTWYTDLH